MNYWLTTHWPPREDAPDDIAGDVWLADGKEGVGMELGLGDPILVYQTKGGRTEIRQEITGAERRIRCLPGREGIIAIGRASSSFFQDPKSKPETYVDGTRIWWRWRAPLKRVSRSGFVGRETLNSILGYEASYNYRGLGPRHSGLRKITQDQYYQVARAFEQSNPPELPNPPASVYLGGVESEEHRKLKELVASDPERILGERGLQFRHKEYLFPTGDKADVVLADHAGRIVGVEIEVSVENGQWAGLLQAIKYRYMLEAITARQPGDSRAMLVAHYISPEMRDRAGKYGVECYEVPVPMLVPADEGA